MLELREWIAASPFDARPWLILGKGPSFSRRHEFPLEDYHLLGLNNVVREQPVDVAHVIDVDVIPDIADRLLDDCRYLLMPRRPHEAFVPTRRLLEDFFDDHPVLRELDRRGRL